MTTIIAFNFLAFVYIATAYVVIYRASSRPCVRKSVRRRTKQWRQDNRTMQKKILCLGERHVLVSLLFVMIVVLAYVKLYIS